MSPGDIVKLSQQALDMNLHSQTPNRDTMAGVILRISDGHPIVRWRHQAVRSQGAKYHPDFIRVTYTTTPR